MLRLKVLCFLLFFYCEFTYSQDTVYARQIIKTLTSQKCYGRGYIKNGLHNAEKFIVSELKQHPVTPLFNGKFNQTFYHPVNTFPNQCEISINNKKLIAGKDFILNPNSKGTKGQFTLVKIDSTHFINNNQNTNISLVLKKKLTYSVGNEQKPFFEVEIKSGLFNEEIKTINIDVKNKWINKFKSNNIGCFIKGSSNSDSCIIFSAHYDHLGGMGNNAFFPGANDNASGVSVLLNLIKYYSVHKPKYKTVFLFFAGEEAGLLGSKHFVKSNTLDLKQIKFLINLDLLGTGDEGIMVVNGAIHENEFQKLSQINERNNLVKQIKKRGKAANSDHYWFTEAGVPAFFIYTMGGITAYHDVDDVEKTLPLTDYVDVMRLILNFVNEL